VRFDATHAVPGARCGPDLVELQQAGVDELAQVGLVAEGRHATTGL